MRKRKFHILGYPGSTWAACGSETQFTWSPSKMVVHNAVNITQLKSPCKITCKLCRKNWEFKRYVGDRKRARAAHT